MEETEKQEREDRFVIIRFDILTNKNLTPSEKLVYARICGFKKYFESKEICSEILGVSKDTVIKAKQKLLELGYIRELENTGRGKVYQPVYDIETRVAKTTSQSGKKPPVRVVKSTNQSGKIYQSEWQNLPIRVVKSTTIEERESKERIKENSSNEESKSFTSTRKTVSKASRVSKNFSESKNSVVKNNTPPKSPPISVKLGYDFCTEHKLPILNNTTFKTKMKQLAEFMDNDDAKITRYFEALEKLQSKECLDDPYCPKLYNCLDIYGKYNNIKTYYTRKIDEKKAKMSPVAELMAKQNGTYDTGGIL